jgi:hypothetical protein
MREKYLRNNKVLTESTLKNTILLTIVIILSDLLNNHFYHLLLFKTATDYGCAPNVKPEI